MPSAPYRLQDLFTIPGLLSLSRVGLAISFPFVLNKPWMALGVIAAAGVSDVLDGYLARLFDQSTPTGAALDSLADKLFAGTVVVTLILAGRLSISWAVLLHLRELGELPLLVWFAASPRVRRLRAAMLGSNLFGKFTTVLQFGALLALLFSAPSYARWIIATAIIGAMAAWSYWVRVLTTLRSGNPENPIRIYWPARSRR